jgi:hypothetical protein
MDTVLTVREPSKKEVWEGMMSTKEERSKAFFGSTQTIHPIHSIHPSIHPSIRRRRRRDGSVSR